MGLFGLAVPVALVLITLATRLPFASEMLFTFDSTNYALALRDYYNVVHHQPHPPGYPLYVAIAKVIDLFLADPNRSLVLVSIGAATVAVWLTYALASAMHGRWVAVIASVVLITSPGFWGYSEVAYPYTALAAGSTLLALFCWRIFVGAPRLAAVSGIVVALVAGVRWDAALFLAPLWLLALLRVDWRARLLAGSGFVLGGLTWAVPMIQLSGGWDAYWTVMQEQSAYIVRSSSILQGGIHLLRSNLEALVTYLRQSLGVSLLVLVFAIGRVFGPWRLASDLRARFLLLWMLPALAVYVLVHIGNPGYVLAVAPAASILVAWTLVDLGGELRSVSHVLAAHWPRWSRASSLLGAQFLLPLLATLFIAGWSANVFLTAPGPARLPEIRTIDTIIRTQTEYARTHADPARTVVLAHARYRQLQYYLPEFDVRLLFDEYQPDYRSQLATMPIQEGLHTVLLMDEHPSPQATPTATPVLVHTDPEVIVWVIDVRGAREVEYGYERVAVLPGG